jgi:cytochrome c oxidase subunit 2
MPMAIVLILLVVGSLAFHFVSIGVTGWWFTPIASNWTMMDTTVNITFWVTGIVFVAVNLFMAYAVMRFRHRKGQTGQTAKYEPENKKLEIWLTVITSVGVAAMLTPGLFVWAQFVNVPKDAAIVEAVGRQWNWSFRLPGPDGALGATNAKFTTPDNPFGIDPDDARGHDDVLVPGQELHLPLGKSVKLLLRSTDVLHDFTVPQFRVKMDLVPGMVTHVWLTPTKVGTYEILCEELCGLAHFAMRGRVVVDEPAAFDTWLASQATFASTTQQVAGDPAAGQASYATCMACHGAQAEGNQLLNAPKLAGQPGWYLARQLNNFRHQIRGGSASDTFGAQMVGFASLLDDTATRNLIAYVTSLPDSRPQASLVGDAAKGKALYATCAGCHGASGEGIWTTSAPRLAHMSDWYLERQLKNFRQGIRGGHPQDFYGAQMAMLANSLKDEHAVANVTAYINTLNVPAPAQASNDPATVTQRVAQR